MKFFFFSSSEYHLRPSTSMRTVPGSRPKTHKESPCTILCIQKPSVANLLWGRFVQRQHLVCTLPIIISIIPSCLFYQFPPPHSKFYYSRLNGVKQQLIVLFHLFICRIHWALDDWSICVGSTKSKWAPWRMPCSCSSAYFAISVWMCWQSWGYHETPHKVFTQVKEESQRSHQCLEIFCGWQQPHKKEEQSECLFLSCPSKTVQTDDRLYTCISCNKACYLCVCFLVFPLHSLPSLIRVIHVAIHLKVILISLL